MDKKLFDLPEILTFDGRQVTGNETDLQATGDCIGGCCNGSPSLNQTTD